VTSLASDVRAKARSWQAAANDLLTQLQNHAVAMGIDADTPRLRTAQLAKDLLARLANENDDVILVQILAEAPLPDEQQALARSMSSAATVAGALQALMWTMLDSLRTIGEGDPRRGESDQVLADLAVVAAAEELHSSLPKALTDAVARAGRILAGPTTAPPPSPPRPNPSDPPIGAGELPADHVNDIALEGLDDALDGVVTNARRALQDNPGRRLHVHWWLE
jgi:hypothetical protein